MKSLLSHLALLQGQIMKTNQAFEDGLKMQMVAIGQAYQMMDDEIGKLAKEDSSTGFRTLDPIDIQLRYIRNNMETFNMVMISMISVLGEIVKRLPEKPNEPFEDKDAIIAGQQDTMKRLSEEMHRQIAQAHNVLSENIKLKNAISKMKDIDPQFNETFMKHFKDLLA